MPMVGKKKYPYTKKGIAMAKAAKKKSKNINLTVTGCMGRMGQQIIKASKRMRGFKTQKVE